MNTGSTSKGVHIAIQLLDVDRSDDDDDSDDDLRS